MQLKEALSKITATVAAQKRRTTRETLYRHGKRISLRVEEQIGQMLTDIAKETEPTTQRQLRRGQKRKAEISSGETRDNPKRYHNEEREDELRQGRRIYEIQGTKQAGYILNLRRTHGIGGTIQITEQASPSQENGNLEEQTLDCLTDEDDLDFWKTLVDFWAGTSENQKQEADTVTATKSTQSDTARSSAANSEAEPVRTSADSTRAQTEKVSEEKSETEEAWHSQAAAGKEESKEEQVAQSVGRKRSRRRRS